MKLNAQKLIAISRLAAVSLAAFALLACSSGVKLDDVQVVDKSGQAVASMGAASGAGAGAVAERSVPTVQIPAAGAGGLGANAAKVVYFDYDSFVIKPEFQGAVDAHAKYLMADKTRKLAIEGHTDERGGREYNLALGQKRSEAVRRALSLLGVGDGQTEAVSFGKEKPAATGADEDSYARNRRAEINYR